MFEGKKEKNTNVEATFMDHVLYQVENRIAAHPITPFSGLALLFCFLFLGFGVAWYYLTEVYSDQATFTGDDDERDHVFGYASWEDSFFLSLQV